MQNATTSTSRRTIRTATTTDLPAIECLLTTSELPTSGVAMAKPLA